MKVPKPQSYLLEMGLDAGIIPASDGTYALVRSLARFDAAKRAWVPAWDTEFQPGDRIVFRIFDYTAGVTVDSLFQLKIFDLHFLDPRIPNRLRSPFSATDPVFDNPITIGPTSLFQNIEGLKSVATSSQNGWVCLSDRRQNIPPYFKNELVFTFSPDVGRFLFHLEVKVTYDVGEGNFELRTYDHDPEIFVGEGG
jgi:hypothetical protein